MLENFADFALSIGKRSKASLRDKRVCIELSLKEGESLLRQPLRNINYNCHLEKGHFSSRMLLSAFSASLAAWSVSIGVSIKS